MKARADFDVMPMEPRFTRGEYWLLETVVEMAMPLCWLVGEQVDEVFNKPGHGLDRGALVESLARLFEVGLIRAGDRNLDSCSILLLRPEIERLIDEPWPHENPSCTCYGLTPEGGRQWEAFAAPQWDRFITRYERPSAAGRWSVGSITSSTAWRVDRLLEGAEYMHQDIDRVHIHRKTHRPWRATYWKTLDIGHEARYRYEQRPEPDGGCGFQEAPLWFMDLFENRWYRWS